ncbi:MAG TPA: LamG domain-containing protein, partial [Planctomycetaceae bacterium]|nr:LamG domain-containing protein [Planctomycetaceae bacterium]
MYQVISEEMLNMFATVTEFNNVIGEPANRYRPEYKALGKLREAFFRKVTNTPDFNKFVDYYRWIDDSLTTMLMQLIPATANFSDGVKTMIESHILERNKYWTKFPSMEFKGEPTIGFVKGISELTYDWKHGHAPLNPTQYSNEDTNCLWWKERSEASGSTSGDVLVDTDRNTLRRILTSDVTTNKILATGEYTDPTDYPNSGFPNAAQFNLSQDGNDLDARTQYKGSTYALRRFSKPYKMHLEKSLNLHGGTNPPSNNKGIDYLWSTHRAFSNAASTNSTKFILEGAVDGDADYNLKESKCADNIAPIEIRKIRRSSETQPYATADATDALKSMLVSPFQYFSQSSDIETSRARSDVDDNTAYFGLHDDSYGELNETPIQGPFTQAHVGGRQYRHFEASSSFLGTDHDDSNRAEGYRIAAAGETVYGPRTTDLGASAPQNAAGMYYRDEVAKRPLNIKNIQSTTASSALGNYDRLSQVVITNADESMFYAKLQAAHDDAGLHSLLSGTSSPIVSDTHDFAKLRAVGKTVLDSDTVLTAPYDSTQVDPYLTKHSIIERFSAPGGPDTAGDAFGGFGIDRETNRYAVYNALPWRNLAVRTPLNAMQTAHCAKYGSLAGSALSATDVTTAGTASFHKVHRNSDYDIRNTSALTAYRANSLAFGYTTTCENTSPSIKNLQKWTYSAWYYPTSTSQNYLLLLEAEGSSDHDLQIWHGGSDGVITVYPDYDNGTHGKWVSSGDAVPLNVWSHIVVVWDIPRVYSLGERPKIYVNGEAVSVTPHADKPEAGIVGAAPQYWGLNVSNVLIGHGNHSMEGYVQDVSLWNRALNPTAIKHLYRLPGYDSAGPGDLNRLKFVSTDEDSNALISWWKFGDSTSTITDSAPIGNGNDLTVSNPGAISTTTFLPANYYATDCIETKDNWFIQHPI